MADVPVTLDTGTTEQQSTRLASDALGVPSVIFCIVTGAAPMTAMLFNIPIAVEGGGFAAPAAFVVATAALVIFSVGYIAMSRYVRSAGGFYVFLCRGLGRVVGISSGVLIALCYMVFTAAVIGVMGYFAATSVRSLVGVDLPAWAYMALGLGVISVLAWFHVELTAKVLGTLLVAEVLALLLLSLAVFAHGGAHGFPVAPLNPVALFGNPDAVRVFGAGAAGVALFAAFWSWVGFEMAPNYAEESRDPHRAAGIATYASVLGLGVFYVLVAYAFVIGWGRDEAVQAVKEQLDGVFPSVFYPLADRYVGAPLTAAMEILAVTSSFACAMAFYNTAARYLFALGREGILPATLARTSTRHSPVAAAMAVTILSGVYVLGFVLYDPSNEGALAELGTWTPLLGVLGILAVQALTSVAVISFFLTKARGGFHWFRTLVAPVIGGVAMVAACYLLVTNRSQLAGGDAAFVRYIPEIAVGFFALGLVAAIRMRIRKPDQYALVGSPTETELQSVEPPPVPNKIDMVPE
jgi:amino acid transporter